jgi:ubiquinone biosynthesis protein Coq4
VPEIHYAYSLEPTRNPFRYLLALWRTVRDPTDTTEVSIVEMGFARSRVARRFARWEEIADVLRCDSRTASALLSRRPCDSIDLEALGRMRPRTLGRVFAEHCRTRDLNPNLGYIPPDGETGWILHHLVFTHDVWHVVSGWGNDEIGEYGLGGFYLAQLAGAPFFGYLLAIATLSTVLRRRSLSDFMDAVVMGYGMGKRAEPLFGVDWSPLWEMPLEDVRARFGIGGVRVLGEGIRAAA